MALTTSQAEWQLKAACRGPQAAVFFPPTTPERRDEKRFRETIAKGDPVRVVAIEGLYLEIEPEEGGARDYREMRGNRGADADADADSD